MDKYVNQIVEMIYVDRSNRFTKRKVRIFAAGDQYVRAYCYDQKGFRTFKQENILAILPVSRAG